MSVAPLFTETASGREGLFRFMASEISWVIVGRFGAVCGDRGVWPSAPGAENAGVRERRKLGRPALYDLLLKARP